MVVVMNPGGGRDSSRSDAWLFGEAVVLMFASIVTMVDVLLRHPIICLALAMAIGMLGEAAGWW